MENRGNPDCRVSVGGRVYRPTGRAAAMAAMAALYSAEINEPRIGRIEIRFANGKCKLVIEKHFADIRTEEWLAPPAGS